MTEDEFRKDAATRMDSAIKRVQQLINHEEKFCKESHIDKKTHHDFVFYTYIYDSLEELTQLRARLKLLNDPVIDPITGVKHDQCSPYNVERLKHMISHLQQGIKDGVKAK